MKKQYDVLGVGISAVDDLYYVSQFPRINSKSPITSVTRCCGGPVSTAMAAVGALQGRAAFASRLGNDDLSNHVKQELERHNVDTTHIIEDFAGGPFYCVIVVDQTGSRTVLYDPSKYTPLGSEDVSHSLLESSKFLLVDYLSDPPLIDLVSKAKKAGVLIAGDIEGQSRGALELAALVDHLVVPEDFALWATGEPDAQRACTVLAKTKRATTIVTCGAMGSYHSQLDSVEITHIPSFEVEVFDTTGCGDVFHGAYVLAASREIPTATAIIFASAAAALKANASQGQKHGWHALPDLHAVLGFLQERLPVDQKDSLLKALEPLKPNHNQTL